MRRQAGREGIEYALELFPELKKRWNVAARLLSGGEQQMVVLGQALVSRPQIIIVDEMSLGLAPVVVKRLMPTIKAVADSGTGVLLIEQFAHVALALAEKAYVLDQGRIRYGGTARELSDRPELLEAAYRLSVARGERPPNATLANGEEPASSPGGFPAGRNRRREER